MVFDWNMPLTAIYARSTTETKSIISKNFNGLFKLRRRSVLLTLLELSIEI